MSTLQVSHMFASTVSLVSKADGKQPGLFSFFLSSSRLPISTQHSSTPNLSASSHDKHRDNVGHTNTTTTNRDSQPIAGADRRRGRCRPHDGPPPRTHQHPIHHL